MFQSNGFSFRLEAPSCRFRLFLSVATMDRNQGKIGPPLAKTRQHFGRFIKERTLSGQLVVPLLVRLRILCVFQTWREIRETK